MDRGYKGHGVSEERSRVLISGTRKLGYTLKRHLRRRSAVEPEIGHMKADGLLGRNFLKGMKGDAINAVLCGAGHNLRKILARTRPLCLDSWRLRTPTEVVQFLASSLVRLVWPCPLLGLQAA